MDISQQLLQNGVGVPHIIKTKDKEFIASDQNSHMWILSDFVEGTYFTGNKSYLQPIAQAIHVLQGLLEKIEDAKKLPLNAGAGTWPKTDIILQELFSCEAEWKNLFPSSEMLALEKEATYLERCFDKISTFEKDAKKIIAPTHIDLHPHNILIDAQGNPVIVDIDSLQRADKTQCLAFAAFKLLRQYIAYEKPHDAHLAAKQFMDTLEIPRNEIEIWGNAAMAEVLRRIGIIADLNMREANTQWNNVLHMQLAALHEIPHIFKTEG